MKTVRVVIADDSPFICRLLTQYLDADPDIRVVKTALNGKEAVEAVKQLKPDVMTLDLTMPVMSGIEALEHIMAENPTPVILISGITREAAAMTQKGLNLGAVDFIFKYSPDASISPDTFRKEMVAKVKTAAKIKVIRSIPSMGIRSQNAKWIGDFEPRPDNGYPPANSHGSNSQPVRIGRSSQLVVIGASTGGPLALKELLASLAPNFPFPVIIVQHMPEAFTAILAEQFNRIFPFSVKEAREGYRLSPGTVLIAPGGYHLLINPDGTIGLTKGRAINGHCPSIDVTMQSAAQMYGRWVTGVVLSGMGNDGTEGLLAIYNNCGLTYAQSIESCVLDAMPHSAMKKGIVQKAGTPSDIGRWLIGRDVEMIKVPKAAEMPKVAEVYQRA